MLADVRRNQSNYVAGVVEMTETQRGVREQHPEAGPGRAGAGDRANAHGATHPDNNRPPIHPSR
jgi:hypothetical protein